MVEHVLRTLKPVKLNLPQAGWQKKTMLCKNYLSTHCMRTINQNEIEDKKFYISKHYIDAFTCDCTFQFILGEFNHKDIFAWFVKNFLNKNFGIYYSNINV